METPISDINAEPPIAPPKNEVLVKIEENGLLSFSNQKELASAAKLAIQLSFVPKHLKDEGVEACMAALLMCKQLNLPARALNEFGWIKGKLTAFGSMCWALAERHPEYGEHEMYFLDEDLKRICEANKNLKNKAWAAVLRTRKKNTTPWNEYIFTIEDAKQAKLYPAGPDSPWTKYTKDMLMHKAKKRALDANYASALNGLIYHEDAQEYLEKDVTPQNDINVLREALGASSEES